MDEDLDRLVVRVRADTGGFARDIAAMRAQL
ncbi:MAG: tail tape measure protein, partial [Sphingobium sp.]|nr:tail tape measure protein [Sphingobium sp.]